MPRRLGAVCALLAAAALGSHARAQAPPPDTALAEALFQQGKALLDGGKAKEACPKLEESQRIDPRIGTLLNLAFCHVEIGRTASAWAEFRDAAARARRAGQEERADLAEQQVAELEKKLSRLHVVPPPAGPRTGTVRLDGQVLGAAALAVPLPVDPGAHRLEHAAPGAVTWSTEVEVPPGPATITVQVPELAAAPGGGAPSGGTSPKADATTGGSGLRTAGWIAGGAGIVGIGIGVAFGLVAAGKESDADETCPSAVCPDTASLSLHDDAADAATISTIAIGVGAVLVLGGVVAILASPGPKPAEARVRSRRGVSVSRTGVGLSF